MRARSIILVLLVIITALPAWGQTAPPWEVRGYLSTYTDADTWTWNWTGVRKQLVCPYCGYSMVDPDPAAGNTYTCPDPWDAAGHPAVEMVEMQPRERVLGRLNLTTEDADGDAGQHPLVGRPFHPGAVGMSAWNDDPPPWMNPDPEDVASWLTIRAANLGEDLVEDGDGLRALVVEPGSARASARVQYVASGGGGASLTPQFYRTSGVGPAATDYQISINPYRVSDGDVWYIRHMQSAGNASLHIYSKLYGLDFDSTQIASFPASPANNFTVFTDSGAMRVQCPPLGVDGVWTFMLVIRSNTQTVPSPLEVDYDAVIDGTEMYNDEDEPDMTVADLTTVVFPEKSPYVEADTSNTVTFETDDDAAPDCPVREKADNGDNFTTNECWAYHMPPEAGGRGRLIMQWSDVDPQDPGAAALPPDTYYRTGGEWEYMVDADTPGTRLMTNERMANLTPLPDDAVFVDGSFMCTRVDVEPTGDRWVNSLGTDKGPTEPDDEWASGGLPGVVIGSQQAPPDGYGGEYRPGTRTPSRTFGVSNRHQERYVVCPVEQGGCGARFLASEVSPGDPCPVCSTPTQAINVVAETPSADLQYDAAVPPHVAVDGDFHWMLPDAVRFGTAAVRLPLGVLGIPQQVHVDIPPYQPPSVPAGGTFFENNIDADSGYYGTMVAFHRPGGTDNPGDDNHTWDYFFQSPHTGHKFATAGDTSDPTEAQQICPVCGVTFSEAIANTNGGNCLFCGATLQTQHPHVSQDTLAAEEYDPFGLQVSVLREAALAADQRTVDLGWTAPAVPDDAPSTVNGPGEMVAGADPEPADVSRRAQIPVRNEGNIDSDASMRTGYLLAPGTAGPALYRTGIDPEVRSLARSVQSVPLSLGALFRYRPGDTAFGGGPWVLRNTEATGAAGERASAGLQAGVRAAGGEPYEAVSPRPVPMGQPVGNYAGEVLVYVDLDGNGQLNFYDALHGVTNTGEYGFDPEVDEPFEPIASFTTRMRVVESRLPHSDFFSRDLEPTVLVDPSRNNLQVLWAGQRAAAGAPGTDAPAGTSPADEAAPSDPFNILYANSALHTVADDPLYRGWLWDGAGGEPQEARAVTVSATSAQSNTSPSSYVDGQTDDRWAVWHRSLATDQGVSSQLRFDSSGDTDWTGSSATEYLFGTSGAHSGLTGFTRQGIANRHWMFWHAGPKGREHLRYRWEFDPTSGTVPSDALLHVSNAIGGGEYDFFTVTVAGEDRRFRRPAQSPFTFVKQPSVFGREVGTATDPQYEVNVFFTGHIRALGNSDICWTRFNFGPVGDADFPYNGAGNNFGKFPFPRVVNPAFGTTPPDNDARRMPAIYDADGDVRGYPGEQLQPSPRRQSFQSRDIDWVVTARKPDPAAPDEPFEFAEKPDWTDWLTAAAPKPGLEDYDDPKFYIGVVMEAGGTRAEDLYAVSWEDGSYSRATGLYTVTPELTGISASGTYDLPLNPAHPGNEHLGELIAPTSRSQAEDDGAFAAAGEYDYPSVTLRISPASGTLRWSSPLFTPDNPANPLAVFNSDNVPDIVDVVMYADYTPFVRRVTTDTSNDDSPSAFFDVGDSARLTVFWRRSYGGQDTPHFGRPAFMHRTFTRAVHVGRPPLPAGNITEVRDLTAGEEPLWELASEDNGIIVIEPAPATTQARIGHRIRVSYTDAAGNAQVEQHRVVGWSTETPVPVNTVVAEGSLRVVPEVYSVAGLAGSTVRYWLAWASGRSTFDLRAPDDEGQRVRQSSDVYLAVVAPESSSLIAELGVPRVGP